MIPNLGSNVLGAEVHRRTACSKIVVILENPVGIKSEDSATAAWAPVANDVVRPNKCCFLITFDLCENRQVSKQRSRTKNHVKDRLARCAKLGVRN